MATITAVESSFPRQSSLSLFGLRKLFFKPKKSDPHTLASFYHADRDVARLADDLQRRRTANRKDARELQRRLRQAQQTLMDIIMLCVQEAVPEGERSPRAFRVKYPDEVNLETLNGGLWHSAEILATGQVIINREVQSMSLKPLAKHTLMAISVVRQALREQSVTDVTGYSKETTDVLCWFDHNWAEYELQYIDNMCASMSSEQYAKMQECIVLFSEATTRAIKLGYLTQDMIDYYDPMLMFAIPRLAVVCGLVVHSEGPLDLDRKFCDIPECFQYQLSFLVRIRELLRCLTSDEMIELEKALCSSEGLGTLDRDENGKPRPRKVSMKQNDGLNKENGDGRTKEDLRAAFRDSRDLLHRLFVAVSGVADQLQTNSAREMRLILKGVFAVCDEPVPSAGEVKETKAPTVTTVTTTAATDLAEEEGDELDEPPQSPKEGALKRRNSQKVAETSDEEVSERASVQEPPVWIVDRACSCCNSCGVAFSLIKRRHHCRNCGKIFCGQCSGSVISLPHFGYERPVRVCNRCKKHLK
eukprot:m.307078 g.307078  ORF g.307078 m.307078 type:complete len:531 (+) comp41872_c0_seq1:126-1718(+)